MEIVKILKKPFLQQKKKKIKTIGLTGQNLSTVSKNTDLCISVPTKETSHIQELHIIVLHLLCILIEKKL